MLRNIDDLKETLQSSTDDVMVLVHMIMNNFTKHKTGDKIIYLSLLPIEVNSNNFKVVVIGVSFYQTY